MTRDMIKKKKQGFSFMLQKCKIWHFLKITVLTFFIISPVIFGLQRCTLSQIKALEILFWPCFIIFSPRINICWAIMSRSCQRFFDSPFIVSNIPSICKIFTLVATVFTLVATVFNLVSYVASIYKMFTLVATVFTLVSYVAGIYKMFTLVATVFTLVSTVVCLPKLPLFLLKFLQYVVDLSFICKMFTLVATVLTLVSTVMCLPKLPLFCH